jgi:hypothetical protein
MTGAQIIKAADKNGDGVLSIDEFGAEHRAKFPAMDANGDGEVDVAEIDAALKPKAESKAQVKPDAESKAQVEPEAKPEPMGPNPES